MRASLSLVVSGLSVLLSGCASDAVFPNSGATVITQQSSLPGIQGSNYGGHAPLVGAHIYVVQPGTTGYGSVVTGLLKAGGTTKYPTTQNGSWTNSGYATDQFVPSTDAAGNPFYGVTTDSNGEFNITGDYVCTVGQPVMLIGYGGNPSYLGTGPNVFSISTEETYNNGSTGVYLTYVISSPLPELFYVGESVTVSGNTGGSIGFNQTGTVLGSGFHYDGTAAPLSTTSFSIFVPYNATLTSATGNYPPGAYGGGSVIATGTPTFNPAAVNMAMLGICPSSGNFSTAGNGAIHYVYMNEISTTAIAYAMNQYANWSVTDQSGNDEFHIGSPNDTQALQGMANAAITAGLLYDIQGGNIGTVPDGDIHIARSVTPNGGNGIVPQSSLNAVGNILAACVDSANTYRLGTGTISTACKVLFQQAEDNGYVDTTASTHQAFNIAQAAFNIAHYPQALGTATTACGCYGGTQTYTAGTASSAATFASTLFNIPTGNVPFNPSLSTAPNDFSMAIQWSNASANGGTAVGYNDVQVDSKGNVWAPSPTGTTSQVFEFTPSGTVSGFTGVLSSQAQIAIDSSGNAWVPAAAGNYKFTSGTAAETLVGTAATATLAGGIAVDASANQYFVNNSNTNAASVGAQTSAGAAISGFPATQTPTTCTNVTRYLTLDSAGSIWTTDASAFYNGATYVCRYAKTGGAAVYSYAMPYNVSNFSIPHFLATDAADNLIFVEKNFSQVYKITAGTTTANTGATAVSTSTSAPIGVVVDGANSIWISNQNANGAGAGGIVQYSDGLVRITPNYLLGAGLTPNSLGPIAADPSGNVWTAGGTVLYEYVGVATPTVTPLATAKSLKETGTKP